MSQLNSLTERFTRRIVNLRDCCVRMEMVYGGRGLLVRDVELVYASSFLAACSYWESLLEEVLYEVSCGQPSRRAGNFRLVKFRTRRHLRDVLLYPRKHYVSLGSVAEATEVAALFVNEGRPFAAISEANRTLLQQAGWIRNAIAHQSAYALTNFRSRVPGATALPPHRQFPGSFLRVVFRTSPDQRRYEPYFAAMAAAAVELRQAWG